MPNILALTDKETGERQEGRGLIEVDEKRIAVIDWLSSHYDLDGYAIIGRR